MPTQLTIPEIQLADKLKQSKIFKHILRYAYYGDQQVTVEDLLRDGFPTTSMNKGIIGSNAEEDYARDILSRTVNEKPFSHMYKAADTVYNWLFAIAAIDKVASTNWNKNPNFKPSYYIYTHTPGNQNILPEMEMFYGFSNVKVKTPENFTRVYATMAVDFQFAMPEEPVQNVNDIPLSLSTTWYIENEGGWNRSNIAHLTLGDLTKDLWDLVIKFKLL